jgi:hypothetical protein
MKLPPGKKEPSTRPSNRGRRNRKLKRVYRPWRSFASSYSRLLFQRTYVGLLRPFRCSGCGLLALDPIGWNGHRQPLCEACSEGSLL